MPSSEAQLDVALDYLQQAEGILRRVRDTQLGTQARGLIATRMSRRAQADPAVPAHVRRRQPLGGTLGAPEDVAGAALFLASDLGRFVTGEVIEVAGGWSVAG